MEKDERQIFDKDAENLSSTLIDLGYTHIFSACFDDFYINKDFAVLEFSIDKSSIEQYQAYFHEITNMDSFIFSEYPLRFLILRPVYTISAYMYIIGEVDFILKACAEYSWAINCFED